MPEENAKSLHQARRRGNDRQTKADFNAQRNAQAAESRRLTEEAKAGRSRHSRGRNIRSVRERERDAERRTALDQQTAIAADALPDNVIPIPPVVAPRPPVPPPENSTYVPPASYDDLLDQAWDVDS